MSDPERISVQDLCCLDYNPRKISKKRFNRLQASIKEHTKALDGWDPSKGYRFAETITVNRNGNRIVGGHRRIEALVALGQDWVHSDDITWVKLDPDSAEEKALCISLNDEEASGRWDEDKKNDLLKSIQADTDELYEKLSLYALRKKVKEAAENSSKELEDSLEDARERKKQFVDNTSFVVQEILEKYGDTIKNGFMLFTYKNRTHLIVQCDDDTYALTKMVGELLKRDNAEVNKFLSVAFRLGIENSGWESEEPDEYLPEDPGNED